MKPTARDWAAQVCDLVAGPVELSELRIIVKVQEYSGLLEETHGIMYFSISGAKPLTRRAARRRRLSTP